MQTSLLQDPQEGGSSATHHHHHHLSPTTTTTRPTTKRPLSPSSTTPSPKKSLKKSPTTQGFSKITLPITFPPFSSPTTTAPAATSAAVSPPLHRTISEPISSLNPYPLHPAPFSPFSASSHFLSPKNQETKTNSLALSPPSSSSLHKLLRSISDPTTLSFGHENGQTPSSMRLKKMKGLIKGISQLCEVISEEENENEDYSEDVNNEVHNHNKDCSDSDNHDNNRDDQEAVSIEKKGDSLVVNFNCPCGLGYEILLSGKDCYYRLT